MPFQNVYFNDFVPLNGHMYTKVVLA